MLQVGLKVFLNADKKYANQEELFGIFVKPDLADES
jgi:hypothetical protein